MRNLITDVPGVLVGNAHDARMATGVTVVVFERSTVAAWPHSAARRARAL